MLRFFSVLSLPVLISTQAFAQKLSIKNEVLQPLSSATIVVLSDSTVYTSNPEGEAQLNLSQTEEVSVSYVGYESKRIRVSPNDDQLVILSASSQQLNEVMVEGFQSNSRLNKQAGSIAKLSPSSLYRFDESSLVNAVSAIPGVRFEQRAAASYRVSIRGSSIRSPFGVRNVKVYWNGIPFTEPGGNTFLNSLDLSNTSQLEIIKGPGASIYGAGNGGVIKIKSTDLSSLSNASQLQFSVGSFGLLRLSGKHNVLNNNSSLTLKWASQESDGYREHNAMDRKTVELDALFFPDNKRTISASVLYSDLFYEIPGGLNPDQRAINPRQPRPRSIERNSSVSNELFLLKLGQEYQINDTWTNTTNLSLSTRDFENPFILDYKRDNQQVFALRTAFEKQFSIGGKPANWTYGIEYQKSFFDGKNFGNVNGVSDTIRFADEIESVQSIVFANLNYDLSDDLSITAGLSRNFLEYDIERTIDKINNSPQGFVKDFDAVWTPRLALSKQINSKLSAHFSVMGGFSPPTTTEVRTNEGSLNRALQAEKGVNYEFNFRGATFNNKLSFDLALFHFRLKDAITTFTNGDGVVLFRNAGETRQNGVELSTQINWLEDEIGAVKSLQTRLSYTYHDFSFENYTTGGDDFSGNPLPGTSPHVANIQTDLSFDNGLYLNLTYHYSDPIALNDENTFFSRAYNLVNLRAGYHGKIGGNSFELFTGIDNLFDVSYSLGNDLNAFGRRYYQPAASINYYFGIKLKLNH